MEHRFSQPVFQIPSLDSKTGKGKTASCSNDTHIPTVTPAVRAHRTEQTPADPGMSVIVLQTHSHDKHASGVVSPKFHAPLHKRRPLHASEGRKP